MGVSAAMPPTERRFPPSVYSSGDEPDPRFSLANERTYLAWLRTSLALMACGVALEALGSQLHPGLRLAAALLLVVSGALGPVFAWFGWMSAERALRSARPLPAAALALPLGAVIGAAGVLLVLSMILA
jgi:putative membrane protein